AACRHRDEPSGGPPATTRRPPTTPPPPGPPWRAAARTDAAPPETGPAGQANASPAGEPDQHATAAATPREHRWSSNSSPPWPRRAPPRSRCCDDQLNPPTDP